MKKGILVLRQVGPSIKVIVFNPLLGHWKRTWNNIVEISNDAKVITRPPHDHDTSEKAHSAKNTKHLLSLSRDHDEPARKSLDIVLRPRRFMKWRVRDTDELYVRGLMLVGSFARVGGSQRTAVNPEETDPLWWEHRLAAALGERPLVRRPLHRPRLCRSSGEFSLYQLTYHIFSYHFFSQHVCISKGILIYIVLSRPKPLNFIYNAPGTTEDHVQSRKPLFLKKQFLFKKILLIKTKFFQQMKASFENWGSS